MSTPNPLAPQGSLLEQQGRGRSTFQIISFIGALHVVFLCGLLWIGCKKEEAPKSPDAGLAADGLPPLRDASGQVTPPPSPTEVLPPVQNPVAGTTGPATTAPTNLPPVPEAVMIPPPPVTEVPPAAGTTHKVQKGETGVTIAKRHGVTLKALQEANPNVNWNRLKVDDVVQIPAASAPAPSSAAAPAAAHEAAGTASVYEVKPGDTGTKIAKATGVSWKRIRAANNLKSDTVRVGQKLKIPGGSAPAASAAAPAPAPAPAPVAVPLPTSTGLPGGASSPTGTPR